MYQKIQTYLRELEQERNIKVLLACETGSRAWGFPSPDSDYDVRLLYVHPVQWYLRLSEPKDSIDLMFEAGEIDISGWDLRKALRLLKKSNCALLERLQSHIVYQADAAFVQAIPRLAPQYYSRIASVHHYLSLGTNAMADLDRDQYRLKKFFYALRAATVCRWIISRSDMPPIHFPTMLDGLSLPETLTQRIYQLIELKAEVPESYLHAGEADLLAFIEGSLEHARAQAHRLPAAKGTYQPLDALFLRTLEVPLT